MHRYEYSVDGTTWKTFSEMYEIESDLKQLLLGDMNIFLVNSIPPVDGVFTIQADGVKTWRGIFKKRDIKTLHGIEVLIGDVDDAGNVLNTEKIYRLDCADFDEVYQIFENYILHQKLPAYEQWEDMSDIRL